VLYCPSACFDGIVGDRERSRDSSRRRGASETCSVSSSRLLLWEGEHSPSI